MAIFNSNSGGSSSASAFLVRAPIGTIVVWSGTADNIPTGWHLCDGTEGTIDLRDRFVLGAGTHPVGETGGIEEVTLTVEQMPAHAHRYLASTGAAPLTVISQSTRTAASQATWHDSYSVGGDQPHPNMPPYYALCWIQKITADPADGVTQDELTAALEGKQDTITGAAGQVVGFDEQGQAVAQEAPEGGEIYSTEERVVGRWIDGRPVYRKTVYVSVDDFPFCPSPTTVRGLENIAPENIDRLISFSGVIDEQNMQLPINSHFTSSVYLDMECAEPSSRIVRYAGSQNVLSFANGVYLFFEYTKTTDQPTT